MIYLEMYGRLGNQFFRYAAAKALQHNLYKDEEICINFQQINDAAKTDPTFYNVLQDFNVSNYEIYEKGGKVIFNESNAIQRAICTGYYIGMRKYLPDQMFQQVMHEEKWLSLLNSAGVYWFRRGSWNFKKTNYKNKFLSGNFEDPAFFSNIRSLLIKEFTPKHALLSKNEELYKLIRSKSSICLSVRRGDFESNKDVQKLQSVCDREYFEKAIHLIKQKVPDAVFFMFSDDIAWVHENIHTDCETYYEDGTDPVWEKLRLMSACKHFIISNSTFSWWVQYLSEYDNKVVVSPNRWFNNDYESPLIDKSWELIKV